MKKEIKLIFGLIIESFLLGIIVLSVILGILGFFLPILPGALLIGLGIGLYLLMLKDKNNRITPLFHRSIIRPHLNILKNNKKFMGLIKRIKKKKKEKIKREIVKYGMILFGFNAALTAALFFALTGLMVTALLLNFSGIALSFIPLMVIFLFAAACAIIWYRFGQILNQRFKKNKIFYSALVVVISVIPLLLILFFLSLLIGGLGITSELLIIIFIGTVFVTVLAVIFEILIVSLGVVATKK